MQTLSPTRFALLAAAAFAAAPIAAHAQASREQPRDERTAPTRAETRRMNTDSAKPTGPFDNQIKKFTAPLSANGGR